MNFPKIVALAAAAAAPRLGPKADVAAMDALLAPRQTGAPDLIDPVDQPYCDVSSCWHFGSDPPELCPLLDGPCPDDENASDNDGRECGMKQYDRACYCGLKTGLSCAWSCDWETWWDTEDWLARVCPDSPSLKIDFSGFPGCARDCLDDASFAYGCITGSSNCFCSAGNLWDCHDKCSSDREWDQMRQWLQDTCDIGEGAARAALEDGTFSVGDGTAEAEPTVTEERVEGPPPRAPPEPPTWDETFMFVVLGVTFLASVGFWIHGWVAGRRSRARPS